MKPEFWDSAHYLFYSFHVLWLSCWCSCRVTAGSSTKSIKCIYLGTRWVIARSSGAFSIKFFICGAVFSSFSLYIIYGVTTKDSTVCYRSSGVGIVHFSPRPLACLTNRTEEIGYTSAVRVNISQPNSSKTIYFKRTISARPSPTEPQNIVLVYTAPMYRTGLCYKTQAIQLAMDILPMNRL